MARATAAAPPNVLPAPPFRLRFVLAFALAAVTVAWLYPRVVAAWRLNGLAAALADYGACMVGPTGPALLRGRQVDAFAELVRRRLVTAPAGEAPFARCAPFAGTLTGSNEAERVHRAAAFEFAEYGGNPAPSHRLSELAVSPGSVADQARRAWPIIRGYSTLVKPSLGAHEAQHPVAPPKPATGRGLPNARAYYRTVRVDEGAIVLAFGAGANLQVLKSTDGGTRFVQEPTSIAADFAERCPMGQNGQYFALQGDRLGTMAVSMQSGALPRPARLAGPNEELVAVACDERVLVAAARAEGQTRAVLRRCVFRGDCAPMPEPNLGRPELGLDFPLDLARVSGTTVMALTMGDIVRVVSARDGGGWTPPTVAYDGELYPLRPLERPSRLLTIGRRVLLHGVASRSKNVYGLLYSDNQGASFRGL